MADKMNESLNRSSMSYHQEYTDREHIVSAFSDIKDFRDTDEFCDVSIKVENQEIKAHRVILAAGSQYFKTVFGGRSPTTFGKTLELPEQSFVSTKYLIDYIYNGKIEICLDTVKDIYKTADFLQIDRVKTICSHYLKTSLCKENCLILWNIAGDLQLEDLESEAKKQTVKTVDQLHSSGTFQNLPFKKVEALFHESSEHARVEKIYGAIIAWVKHDIVKRKKLLGALLKFIAPQKISREFLRSTVIKETLLPEDLTCMVWMHQIFVSLFESESSGESEDDDSTPTLDQKGQIFVSTVRGKYSSFYKFDTNTSEIEDLPARTKARYSFPIIHKDSIYFTGGLVNSGCSNQCERYKINDGSWDVVSLDCDRYYHGACVLKDQMFIIGGCKDHQNLNTGKTYDFETGQWMNIPNMSTARKFFGIAKYYGCIYVMGGMTDKIIQSTSVERYDPREGIWHNLPRLNQISSSCSAAVASNVLYCSAFRTGMVEQFIPRTNQWTDIPSASSLPGCLISTKEELYRATAEGMQHFDRNEKSWNKIFDINSFSTEIVAVAY